MNECINYNDMISLQLFHTSSCEMGDINPSMRGVIENLIYGCAMRRYLRFIARTPGVNSSCARPMLTSANSVGQDGPVTQSIKSKLFEIFAPDQLIIDNESNRHNVPKNSEVIFAIKQ
jgi:hypothetical protein